MYLYRHLSQCLFPQLVMSSPSNRLFNKQRAGREKWHLPSLYLHSLWLHEFKSLQTTHDMPFHALSDSNCWFSSKDAVKASSSFKTIAFPVWRVDEVVFVHSELCSCQYKLCYMGLLSRLTGVWIFIRYFCQLLVPGSLKAPLQTFFWLLTGFLSIFYSLFTEAPVMLLVEAKVRCDTYPGLCFEEGLRSNAQFENF